MDLSDRQAFIRAFRRMMATLKDRFPRCQGTRAARCACGACQEMRGIMSVYFDSLKVFSLDAVEAAERIFREEGNGWFPSSPEWGDVAAEMEVAIAERIPIPRALPPAPHVVQADLRRIAQARAACVALCREKGWSWIAEYFEHLPLRHVSDVSDPILCVVCSDAGVVIEEGRMQACGCLAENPAIRRRHTIRRRLARLEARRRRAADLDPGSRSLARR